MKPNDIAGYIWRQVKMTAAPQVDFRLRPERRAGLVPNPPHILHVFSASLVFFVAVSRRQSSA
jgi:hypothetical protein